MACPAVAGAVALMKAANPNLKFADILKKLQDTATRPSVASSDLQCGNVNKNNAYPNNAYGHGIINVFKAIN
jgi:subtilisin family serine protease